MAPKNNGVADLVRLLEKEPLYSKITVGSLEFGAPFIGREWFKVPKTIRIDLHCPRCDRDRTFQPLSEYWPRETDDPNVKRAPEWKFRMGRPIFIAFECSSCLEQRAVFALESEMKGDVGIVQKVGHAPSPRLRLDARVAKAMGDSVGLFRQGLTSELHGFGVGAYAYFRQVAENLVDNMLKTLRAEAKVNKDTELLGAIDGINPKAPASDKIGILKDHIPASLRPDGLNPLGAIYKALSQGIHAGTDEDCLDQLRVASQPSELEH